MVCWRRIITYNGRITQTVLSRSMNCTLGTLYYQRFDTLTSNHFEYPLIQHLRLHHHHIPPLHSIIWHFFLHFRTFAQNPYFIIPAPNPPYIYITRIRMSHHASPHYPHPYTTTTPDPHIAPFPRASLRIPVYCLGGIVLGSMGFGKNPFHFNFTAAWYESGQTKERNYE